MEEFAALFKACDMPNEDTKWLAENIGIEATMKIILYFKGMALYIAGDDLIMRLKKKYVAKVYNGKNVREIARKLDVSERTIYRWINEKPENGQYPQISFRDQL